MNTDKAQKHKLSMFSWDWKDKPDADWLTNMVQDGYRSFQYVNDGSDSYVLLCSTKPRLTHEEADALFGKYEDALLDDGEVQL